MKLAVFHDFLDTVGGAERVALTIAKRFDADLVTTNYDPAIPGRVGIEGVRVIDLGPLPKGSPRKHIAAAKAFARCRMPGYDRYVVSGNWSLYATRAHHPNLWYCHTPARMLYDQRDAILARLSAGARIAARAWTRLQRGRDQRAARACDRVVANSENVRSRVRREYGRDAPVIHPPVPTARYRFREIGDFWLSVNRLYPEKRVGLQLDAFRHLPDERLVIVGGVGEGDRAEAYARSIHPPANVELLGEVAEDRLADLYGRCRGLVTTAVDEDFGLTPVEAMASGKCVLATDEGGYRETVLEDRTGFLLPADADAFAAKIRSLDDGMLAGMRSACEARARQFDEEAFVGKMRAALEALAP